MGAMAFSICGRSTCCVKLQVDEKTVEISYLKMEGEAKEIMLPKPKFCQISGNNVDGVILTLWEKRDGKA